MASAQEWDRSHQQGPVVAPVSSSAVLTAKTQPLPNFDVM